MTFLLGLAIGIVVGILFDDKIKPKVVVVYNAVKTTIKG